jgi:hypothetical protein
MENIVRAAYLMEKYAMHILPDGLLSRRLLF